MNLKVLFSVLFAGFLLFGCIGGEVPQEDNKQETDTELSDGEDETPETSEPELDLTSKTFEELVSLGIPLTCEITYKDPEVAQVIQSSVVYLSGEKLRMEMDASSQGYDMSMVLIVPGDGYSYLKYNDPFFMAFLVEPGCEWVKTEVGSEEDDPVQELYDDSKVSVSCVPSVLSDSLFSVSGTACPMIEYQ
ncbi:MAG: hypothetical protein PHU63_00455 [Candidatus ainarchaeum sp.]|nr:hypothetical protein [Candidatus ainarchaeum sp.]